MNPLLTGCKSINQVLSYLLPCFCEIVVPMTSFLKELMTMYRLATEHELFGTLSLRMFNAKDKVSDDDERESAIQTRKTLV